MKTIRHGRGARDELLHIEADGCIVNVRIGLRDVDGRTATSVLVIPDPYAGQEWHLMDFPGRNSLNVRVIEGKAEPSKGSEHQVGCREINCWCHDASLEKAFEVPLHGSFCSACGCRFRVA